LKALFENYLKSSIYFLKNFFEEKQVLKCYFHSPLFKPYSALCKLACKRLFYKVYFIQCGLLFQTLIECVSQSLFYKLLFYYFAKNRVQTLFLLFYASKVPFAKFIKFYWKILFYFKNLFLTVPLDTLNFRKFLKVV
jgi:hypothetical protein